MLNELFQVLLEGPTVDSLMPFRFVVGAILLRPRERKVVLERPSAFDPWLIFDCVVDFIVWELQQSE